MGYWLQPSDLPPLFITKRASLPATANKPTIHSSACAATTIQISVAPASMQIYKSKYRRLPGTSYNEVYPRALHVNKQALAHTKRQPYVRSQFFAKDKVFLAYFWQHLRQKNFKDRARRLRYFEAALDLIRHTAYAPTTKQNPNDTNELLHRFAGATRDDELFYVQIKQNIKTGRKDLLSIFPPN